jgi:NADH-quinone oxidoreductase subunit K
MPMIEGVPLSHILIVSTLIFFIGTYGFLTRKNLITMLISVELILNSVSINFVAFNKYLYPDLLQGHFFTLFVIAIAAAEAAVAIAIFINLYRNIRSVDVEDANELKY